jgi:hypothetical protein
MWPVIFTLQALLVCLLYVASPFYFASIAGFSSLSGQSSLVFILPKLPWHLHGNTFLLASFAGMSLSGHHILFASFPGLSLSVQPFLILYKLPWLVCI